MRHIIFAPLLLALSACTSISAVPDAQAGINRNNCTLKNHRLFGRVQVVTSFPDLRVQKVTSFPDLRVQEVEHSPDKCGEWQFVTSFPDLQIQYVESFPDLRIQVVDAFPGPR